MQAFSSGLKLPTYQCVLDHLLDVDAHKSQRSEYQQTEQYRAKKRSAKRRKLSLLRRKTTLRSGNHTYFLEEAEGEEDDEGDVIDVDLDKDMEEV